MMCENLTIEVPDVETLKEILNYMADSEVDDFVDWVVDNGVPAEGVDVDEWEKNIEEYLELDNVRNKTGDVLHRYHQLIDELATTSTGHIFCQIAKMQDKYDL